MLAGFLGLILIKAPLAILVSTALIGISTVMTMTPILALPPLLAAPGDVARTAAGMLTISYTCAIVIPTLCGALWDMTGKPWIVFVPLLPVRRRADGARLDREPAQTGRSCRA